MTRQENLIEMPVEKLAEVLCDNADCSICPAFDEEYCRSDNLVECSKAMKIYLLEEAD